MRRGSMLHSELHHQQPSVEVLPDWQEWCLLFWSGPSQSLNWNTSFHHAGSPCSCDMVWVVGLLPVGPVRRWSLLDLVPTITQGQGGPNGRCLDNIYGHRYLCPTRKKSFLDGHKNTFTIFYSSVKTKLCVSEKIEAQLHWKSPLSLVKNYPSWLDLLFPSSCWTTLPTFFHSLRCILLTPSCKSQTPEDPQGITEQIAHSNWSYLNHLLPILCCQIVASGKMEQTLCPPHPPWHKMLLPSCSFP